MNLTICSATAAAPGPGELTKLLPSTPSSVRIRRTPIGSLPSRTPNTFRTSVLRSWRTTLMSVMRMSLSGAQRRSASAPSATATTIRLPRTMSW